MATQQIRDSFPDILRGFALLGIAIVNVSFISIDTVIGHGATDLSNPANSIGAFVMQAFFASKFYLLFSVLFGYSAHYVLKGLKENRGRWRGRALGLILLGAAHLTLLFHGDILFLYGVFAFVLLWFYFRKERTIKIWAWVIFILTTLFFASSAALTLLSESFLATKGKTLPNDLLVDFEILNQSLTDGSFGEIVASRLELWLLFAPQAFLLQGPLVFVAFLVGVLLARKNGLGSGANPKLMKRWAIWGLLLGVPLQVLAAWLNLSNYQAESYSYGLELTALSINFLTAPLMSAGLVGLLWLIAKRLGSMKLFSAAGRHSLTIYLSQSVVFSTLFSPWGFDLFGKLTVSEVLLIAFATWLVLSLLALANLKYRNRGPMEAFLTWFSKLFSRSKA